MTSLILATRNEHKLREMQRLFEAAGISVEGLPGDVESFRALGTRFLQMPLGEVAHVSVHARAAA